MSQSVQERVLGFIENAIRCPELEMSYSYAFPNVGTLYVYRKHTLYVHFCVKFDFQSSKCKIVIAGDAVAGGNWDDSPPNYRFDTIEGIKFHSLDFEDSERMALMLQCVATVRTAAIREEVRASGRKATP